LDDNSILDRIGQLADEERALEAAHIGSPLPDDARKRLHEIEVELDQCWDFLNQRRARRSAGLNPDTATVRPEGIVEHFQQ